MFDYIYLSERRLRDLADQLPQQPRESIIGTIAANLPGLLKVESIRERAAEQPRNFDDVQAVEQALREKEMIGSIHDNRDWLSGRLQMYWGDSEGTHEDRPVPVVFFGGIAGCHVVLLGGSRKHLRANAGTHWYSTSDLPRIFGALAGRESVFSTSGGERLPSCELEEFRVRAAIEYCRGGWGGALQYLEFLAKRLISWDNFDFEGSKWRITIGAPLYVRA